MNPECNGRWPRSASIRRPVALVAVGEIVMRGKCALIVAMLGMALAASAPADSHISKKPNAQKAIGFLEMVFNQKKVKEGFDKYVGDKYIQHNPIAADGKEAAVDVLGKALKALPGWTYEIKH